MIEGRAGSEWDQESDTQEVHKLKPKSQFNLHFYNVLSVTFVATVRRLETNVTDSKLSFCRLQVVIRWPRERKPTTHVEHRSRLAEQHLS